MLNRIPVRLLKLIVGVCHEESLWEMKFQQLKAILQRDKYQSDFGDGEDDSLFLRRPVTKVKSNVRLLEIWNGEGLLFFVWIWAEDDELKSQEEHNSSWL